MFAPNALSHHERLRNRGAIRSLFEEGQSGFVYPLRYMWLAKKGEADGDKVEQESEGNNHVNCEVLFTVPKRFHKRANKRNLLRRRVKEAYRLQKSIVLNHGEEAEATEVTEATEATTAAGPGRDIIDLDLAIVYSTKEVHSYKTIENAVRKILENIAKAL